MNWYKIAENMVSGEDLDAEVIKMIDARWVQVDSSFIEAVSYYPKLEILEVRMKERNGKTAKYTYMDVPQRVYNGLMKADSKGQYFNRVIRPKYHRE